MQEEIGLEIVKLLETKKQLSLKFFRKKNCLYAKYNGKVLYTTVKEFVWNYINQPRNAEKVYPIFLEALTLCKNSFYPKYLVNFLIMLLRKKEEDLIHEYVIGRGFLRYVNYKSEDFFRFLLHFDQNDCVQNLLGFVSNDGEQSSNWYKKSADQGNSCGQYHVFFKGVARLPLKHRIEYLKKSAKQNNPLSLCRLGRLYLHGDFGCKINREKALECFKKSASLGYKQAKTYERRYFSNKK